MLKEWLFFLWFQNSKNPIEVPTLHTIKKEKKKTQPMAAAGL